MPPVGSLGGNELCMVPTSTSGALRGSTPNAGLLRRVYAYLANQIPGSPSPFVSVDGSGAPDRYAACRPTNVILLTDGNETCAGGFGAPLNAANLGCMQVDLNGNGVLEDPIPATDPNPDLRGKYERNVDLNRDGDCYDAGEQRAFRVRTYSIQFEGTVGTDCACDAEIENVARYGGVRGHTVGCSATACSGLTGGNRYGYYARSEAEISAVLSQIIADSALVETCNALDDDCDGEIDELFPVGDACTVGVGECARSGVRVCSGDGLGTVCSASPGAPSAEGDTAACGNGVDDDCDGLIDCADDDCVTTSACVAGCVPGVEVCNGADDDCDGRVDEGESVRPCGSSLGVCRPGVETCVEQSPPGTGVAMYGACTATGGSEETCNGLDDDCDGAVDEGLPEGGPCGEAEGLCMPGTERCVAGRIVCAGGVPGRRESCNCMDDDCDGAVDEDPDGSLCPGTSECVGCQCVVECAIDEFGERCPTGRFPDRSSGRCLCVLPPCTPEGCAAETLTRGDAVVCAPDRTDVGPCVCRGVGCEPACEGVTCGAGTICDPFDPEGRCVANDCTVSGCPDGQVCDEARGACVPDPCADVICGDGQVCREGACVADPCNGVRCAAGERCVEGACQPVSRADAGVGGMDAGDRERVLAAGGCACAVGGPTPGTPTTGIGFVLVVLALVVACRRRARRGSFGALVVGTSLGLVASGCDIDPYCLDCNPRDAGRADAGVSDAGADAAPDAAACDPSAAEACNGRDDDCDEAVDEDFDFTSSLEHCGGCDRSCAPPGAFGACVAGECAIDECDVGRVDLDGRDENGCEYACLRYFDVDALCDGLDDDCDGAVDEDVSLATDPLNCGRCGEVCALANAITACADGACALEACVPGFYDLDGLATNGCEYACIGVVGATEACNGVDDDCDGAVDEDVVAPAGLCRTLGACAGAAPACMGVLGFRCEYATGVEVDPATGQPIARETRCDGVDGNCNGAIDESFATLGAVCTAGTRGACLTTGVNVCNGEGTGVRCDAPAPPPPGSETCNGVDDDCDGVVDEPRSSPGGTASYVVTPWVQVSSGVWMMQYEASRPDASATDEGALSERACSRAGTLPWTNLRHADAQAACSAFGARLCTEAELTSACRGTASCTWAWQPSCNTYSTTACNTADYADPDAIMSTGVLAQCYAATSGGAVYDLSGNAKEYAAARATGALPVGGGSYNQIGFGARCGFDWQTVSSSFRFENVGFRCCYSGATPP